MTPIGSNPAMPDPINKAPDVHPESTVRTAGVRRTGRVALAALLACGLPVAAFEAAVAWWPMAPARPPSASTWIVDRAGRPLAAYAAADGQWRQPLTADQIGPHLLDAVVAVEDQRFYHHGGVDWRSAAAAAWQDATSLSLRRGASTIAMQVAHLRQPSPRRSILGKLAQAVRACQIERRSSRRDVLVEYLNRAPFGGNLSGVGAASWRYFGRPCSALSLGQAALLAGLPQGPNRDRPDRHPAAARVRRDHVLDRLLAGGMISPAERAAAAAEPIGATWRALPQDATDDGLRPTLDRLVRLYPGRTVPTTVDAAVQHRVAGAVDDALRTLSASHVSAAAAVVLDTPTGGCLASVSRGAGDEDLTVRPRSSGSTLKPFVYAAAFDAGVCAPGTVLDDAPAAWAGYQPGDYDRRFDGPEPAAVALARSRNVPALVVLSRVGVARAVGVMGAAGLATVARTPDRYGLSLAIGGAEVTPAELAGAYATLGRGGMVRPVTWVTPFSDRPEGGAAEGSIARQTPPSGRSLNGKFGRTPILRPSSCRQALQCLADPVRTRDIFAAAEPSGVAWKTGTSGGHRDAWCAAVTPRRTVVVWLLRSACRSWCRSWCRTRRQAAGPRRRRRRPA